MEIIVNGEKEVIESEITLQDFIKKTVGTEYDRLAIAVNSAVIARDKWTAYILKAGDELEIVRPLQGG